MLGSTGLLIVYGVILTVAESFDHAVTQFADMWIWISLLVIGFGTQVGLFALLKIQQKDKSRSTTAEVAATGGISAGSMIACCAHHVADLLPILGLSAAAVFLTKYQLPFIMLGVFSNLVGIVVILAVMQKYHLHTNRGFFKLFPLINMRSIRAAALVVSAVIVASAFLFTSVKATAQSDSADNSAIGLATQTDDQNLVTFDVTPADFSFGVPLRLKVSMNTHQGGLDFDLTEISMLKDNEGTTYAPLGWEGDAPGGHHRSGTLTFPALSSEITSINLVIENVYDIPARSFIWKLQ